MAFCANIRQQVSWVGQSEEALLMGKMSYLVPMGAVASEIPAGLLSGCQALVGALGQQAGGLPPGVCRVILVDPVITLSLFKNL